MSFINLVEKEAEKIANECWMNPWREWLANRYRKVGGKYYPDRCECGGDGPILFNKDTNSQSTCTQCQPCIRCGMKWCPQTQPRSIHGSLGDYEQWKSVYIARVIPHTWYDQTKAQYGFCWMDFQRDNVVKIEEDVAIEQVNHLLEIYPTIAAWVSLEFLQIALNLRWRKMSILATRLLEHRHQWFTPDGFYADFAETDTYHYCNSSGQRVDLPLPAEYGPYCLPNYLSSQDRQASTINIDHNLEDWLEHCPENKLIDELSRSLACSSAQWGIEECESFHREEQSRVLGIIAHGENRTWSSVYTTPHAQNIYWHSRLTMDKCVVCQKNQIYDDHKTLSKYETLLSKAQSIRQRRMRGVFWCAIRLFIIANKISYIPGIGRNYLLAMADFNQHRQSLS